MPRVKQKPLSRASVALPEGTTVQMPSSIIPPNKPQLATHDVHARQDSVHDQPIPQNTIPSTSDVPGLETHQDRMKAQTDTPKLRKRKAIEGDSGPDGSHAEDVLTQSSLQLSSNALTKNTPVHSHRWKKAKTADMTAPAQRGPQTSSSSLPTGGCDHNSHLDKSQQSSTARFPAVIATDTDNGDAAIDHRSTQEPEAKLASASTPPTPFPVPSQQGQDSIPVDTGLGDCPDFPGRLEKPASHLSIAEICEQYPNSLSAWGLDLMIRHSWTPNPVWNHLPSVYKHWLYDLTFDIECKDLGHLMRTAAQDWKIKLAKRFARRVEFLTTQDRIREPSDVPPQKSVGHPIGAISSQTQPSRSIIPPATTIPATSTQVSRPPAGQQAAVQSTVDQVGRDELTQTQQGGSTSRMSEQALNQIVLEYLNKKGYARTEAVLRAEVASMQVPKDMEPRSAPQGPPTQSQAHGLAAQTRQHDFVEVQDTHPTSTMNSEPSESVRRHEESAAPMRPLTVPQGGPQPQLSMIIRPDQVYGLLQLTPGQKNNYADVVLKCWDILRNDPPPSQAYRFAYNRLGLMSQQLLTGAVPPELPLIPQQAPRPAPPSQEPLSECLQNRWTYFDAANTVDNRRYRTRLVVEYVGHRSEQQAAAAYRSQSLRDSTAILDVDSNGRIYRLTTVFDILGMWAIRAPGSGVWRRYEGALDEVASAEGVVRYHY